MSYTPTEWGNGDIITAEKLNKLESGIQNIKDNILVLTAQNNTLSATYNEIKEAALSGKLVVYISSDYNNEAYRIGYARLARLDETIPNVYGVGLNWVWDDSNYDHPSLQWVTENPDTYPIYDGD